MVLQWFPRGVLSTSVAIWFCNGLQECLIHALKGLAYEIDLAFDDMYGKF